MKQILAWMSLGLWLLATPVLAQTKPPPPSVPQGAGGLGDALVITSVKVVIGHPDLGGARQRLPLGRKPSPVSAVFTAKGGGTVEGRWELASPADGAPGDVDLTPGPLLSTQGRAAQKRLRSVGVFSFSLSPGERYVLAAPSLDSKLFATAGRYHLVLRLDTATSYNGTAATVPGRIAPVVIEMELPRPRPAVSEASGS